MSQVLQYELWRECNCKCTYCTLGEDNIKTDVKLKLKSLQTAIDDIKNMKVGEHETLGFIGGEFFQGQLNTQEVKDKFFELMHLVNDVLNKDIIKSVWINASLLIGEQKDFYDTIDLFDKKSQLWVLTSYDTIGRFHTPKMLETWEGHLKKIHENYPEIQVNITSILTGDFVEKFNNDEIDIEKYFKLYGYSFYFKNPVQPYVNKNVPNSYFQPLLGNFFPTRNNMLKFFMKYIELYGEECYDRLISTDLRADEIRKNYNSKDKQNIKFVRDRETLVEHQDGWSDDLMPCGHNDIYRSYIDSDKCILCDKMMIKKARG